MMHQAGYVEHGVDLARAVFLLMECFLLLCICGVRDKNPDSEQTKIGLRGNINITTKAFI